MNNSFSTHQSPLCLNSLQWCKGYEPKPLAVIWVVSYHRLGGCKYTIDRLPLNGVRGKPSASVYGSLTSLPLDNQAAPTATGTRGPGLTYWGYTQTEHTITGQVLNVDLVWEVEYLTTLTGKSLPSQKSISIPWICQQQCDLTLLHGHDTLLQGLQVPKSQCVIQSTSAAFHLMLHKKCI